MKELLDALSSISSPTRRILRVFFAAVLRRTGNTYNYTNKCRKLEHCRTGIGRRVESMKEKGKRGGLDWKTEDGSELS